MNLDLLILRAINEHGWSRPFATEYVMARHVHGMGHERSIAHARRSPYVKHRDKA